MNRLRRVAEDRFAASDNLYSETLEVLTKLHAMDIRMAIVSNGVNQERRARRLGIDGYFDAIVGSVHMRFAKPSPDIFHMPLTALGIVPQEAIMVGDTWEADVVGAKGVGMRCVHIVRGDGDAVRPDTAKDLWGGIGILTQDI